MLFSFGDHFDLYLRPQRQRSHPDDGTAYSHCSISTEGFSGQALSLFKI
ncbi:MULTISPECIES: hypothetical protein [Pontibacter]|nr:MULTISPECIES: hypothetical protein [Pontibacter]